MLQLKNLTHRRNLLFFCVFGFMMAFASCADDKSKSDQDDVTLEEPEMRDEDDAYKSQKNRKAKSAKDDALKGKKKRERERMSAASMPTFTYPGCEDADDPRHCTIDKIQEYASENFDVKSVEDEIVEGEHTVRVNFMIDNKGNVNQVEARSESSLLADEAKRIISSLPTMNPAMKDGKAIEATYALPVKFKIN
ncbi:energy transducer TonB [Psychroflexus halocasei]|uniref:Protein TonB n=1 Tax=Psychroflexus halocasei TaxID=908615 RepID=A0A1H4DTF4_9FLAO|nr:energy transducer TonB [Psychroflexus halocasei]SEA76034.1 protein TonB [Psychroflexus halocasei]